MSRPTSTPEPRTAGELQRVPEVARRTGLTIRDVYARIDEGSLPAFRDADGLAVVPTAAVDELIG